MISLFTSKAAIKSTAIVTISTLSTGFLNISNAIAQNVTLNGAGATFPAPLYERYISEFGKKNSGITVNYQSIGSGGGIKQFINETVDFGASDAAMTDKEIEQVKKGAIMVPTAGGSLAIVYNLPGVSKLRFSRTTLADIFTAKITNWNDPKIAKDNPRVSLPDRGIKLAVRADGSGTTFIFTNHLSTIDANFKNKIGVNKSPNWLGNPLKGKGNEGVAALVQQTEGTIGYVEVAHAKSNNLAIAAVQNKEGKYVLPTLAEANKALESIKFPDNFRVFEGDPAKGYPITGLTWLLVYKQYDPDKSTAIKKFIEWALTDGQKLNGELDYTKIPDPIAKRAIAEVNNTIK